LKGFAVKGRIKRKEQTLKPVSKPVAGEFKQEKKEQK